MLVSSFISAVSGLTSSSSYFTPFLKNVHLFVCLFVCFGRAGSALLLGLLLAAEGGVLAAERTP